MPLPIPDLGLLLFLALSAFIIISAFWVVISPNLVHSAVSLLFTLFGIAGIYVFLYADFIAATQIVIYVGGILVLIIFGVMLTNKIENVSLTNPGTNKLPGALLSVGLLFIMFNVVFYSDWKVNKNLIYDYNINEWSEINSYYEDTELRWFNYNSTIKKTYSITDNWNIYIYDYEQDEWDLFDHIENDENIIDVINDVDSGMIILTEENKYFYNFNKKLDLEHLDSNYIYDESNNIISDCPCQLGEKFISTNIVHDAQSNKYFAIDNDLGFYSCDSNEKSWVFKGVPYKHQQVHSAVYDNQNDKILVFTNKGIIKEKTISSIGNLLLTQYLLPFEIASIILLAALVGAAMLSRKKVEK